MEYEIPFSPPATDLAEWVHIPTPGDHYSPATGSAVISVIAGLAEAQTSLGEGTPKILVTRGTLNGYPPYPYGKVVETAARCRYPTFFERLTDVVLGRMAGLKPFAHRLYKKLAEPLPRSFSGILVVHNQPGAVLPLRRRFPRARLVLHLHNASLGPFTDAEVAKITGALTALVCCSHFLAKQTLQRVPHAHALKVKALLNGVDTEQFKPPLKRPEADPFPLTILFVGRMLPEKGPDLLLKAASLLYKRRKEGKIPAFRVRLVGSSNFNASAPLTRYERHLRHLAFPLGKTVEFRPFVKRDKVPKLYQEADVFVAPSNWEEPFGLTIAEAMASGLPCVVSKRGGIPELAGEAALYFTPPQVEKLAEQIETLLTQPKLRAELGRRGRARTLELDWPSRFEELRNAVLPREERTETPGTLAV